MSAAIFQHTQQSNTFYRAEEEPRTEEARDRLPPHARTVHCPRGYGPAARDQALFHEEAESRSRACTILSLPCLQPANLVPQAAQIDSQTDSREVAGEPHHQ